MQMIRTALSAFTARSTLGSRRVILLYSGLVVLVLLGVAQLVASSKAVEGRFVDPIALADIFAVSLLAIGLFVIAPAMVAAHVAEERRQGTLDLLRTAPLSPTALTAGFLAGAPGGLYLLLAGPLALHVLAGLGGAYPVAVLPQSLVLLALGAVVLMLVSLLAALALQPNGVGGAAPLLLAGALAMLALIAIGMAAQAESSVWAFVHPAGALAQLYDSFQGPFRDASIASYTLEHMGEGRIAAMLAIEPLFAVAIYGVAAFFLLLAARRTLASDPPSRLSKWEALGLFITAVVAIVVPMRAVVAPHELRMDSLVALGFALVGPYCICVLGATPTATAYAAGGRRGRMAAAASPLLVAAMMLLVGVGLVSLCYDGRLLQALGGDQHVLRALGFLSIAMTLPLYALYASTRISSPAGRLAFWAVIGIHVVVQLPALCIATELDDYAVLAVHRLATLDLVLAVAVPCFVAWRQRVGDRRLAAARV